jgi:hypothetical protein
VLEGAGVLEGARVGGIAEAVLVGVLLTAVGEGAGVFVSTGEALDCKEGVGAALATWGALPAEQPSRHRAKTTKAATTAALEVMR